MLSFLGVVVERKESWHLETCYQVEIRLGLELEGGEQSTNFLLDSLESMVSGFPRVKRKGELNLFFLSPQC